jgi:hypothetical protein
MTTGRGLAADQDETTNPTNNAIQTRAAIANTFLILLLRTAVAILANLLFLLFFIFLIFIVISLTVLSQ